MAEAAQQTVGYNLWNEKINKQKTIITIMNKLDRSWVVTEQTHLCESPHWLNRLGYVEVSMSYFQLNIFLNNIYQFSDLHPKCYPCLLHTLSCVLCSLCSAAWHTLLTQPLMTGVWGRHSKRAWKYHVVQLPLQAKIM